MGKDKLRKFNELEVLKNVFQPPFEEIFNNDYKLKSKWNQEVFKNNKPIVLELGCGKGEYTIGLSEKFPDKNFIGIDIKGARMWKGAKSAHEKNSPNVAFLRTRIEFIHSFFAEDEVSEIWITFPDPQLKKRRNKKRLTSSRFLNSYQKFLKKDGIIHLKSDSAELYEYTLDLIHHNSLELINHTNDLYSNKELVNDILEIRTHYERIFLKEGKPITYIQFGIKNSHLIEEVPEKDE